MDNVDYIEIFDLSPQEQALHLLIVSQGQQQTNLPHVSFVAARDLPKLSFPDQSYDLVLCHNILFQENQHQDLAFHTEVMSELTRVGSEVRIYPLVDSQGHPSQYLGLIIQALQDIGFGIELRNIPAKGNAHANAMLRMWNAACDVKDASIGL